ncbi:MAG: hypothetical protein IJU67_00875, partial [Lachnospiraceae bacterium]|nr:hypothetical protein [Lachnospiraceae bacterium]
MCNSSVERIFLLLEDPSFPGTLPEICTVIDVSGQTYFRKDGPNWGARWTYMAMMRTALAKVLPEDLDRVLSLDVDTIVDRNIDALWNVDLDGYYFAAAHEWHRSTPEYLYTNVGVMLC